MIPPKEKPIVHLIGQDGNAFSIIGRVSKVLRKSGADREYIAKYQEEAMEADYDNLLRITMEYVEVE